MCAYCPAASSAAACAASWAESAAVRCASGSGGPAFCTARFASPRPSTACSKDPGSADAWISVSAMAETGVCLPGTTSGGDRTRAKVTANATANARHKSTIVRNVDERGSCESLDSGCRNQSPKVTTESERTVSVADPDLSSQEFCRSRSGLAPPVGIFCNAPCLCRDTRVKMRAAMGGESGMQNRKPSGRKKTGEFS
jgi:hypothetical protein